LNLAKYAGPAACYPPSRQVCNAMFEAADVDCSGTIDREEFTHIMSVLCAQILSRIVVYYIILILLVPVIAAKIMDWTGILEGSYLEMAANQTTSLALFFVAIPLIWNKIDEHSERRLQQSNQPIAPTNQRRLKLGIQHSA
jgi:EF hand